MWWQYALVFVCTMAVDIVPLPLPPAFVVMILLQIVFDLNIWTVIAIGVVGSVAGRYILTLYIPKLSGKIFNPTKNEDVQYLGRRMKVKGWKSQLFILIYSLLPLPTTPLFIAGGMAQMKPLFILPAFIVGKFVSDTAAVLMGEYAAKNARQLFDGMIHWKSITGLVVGLLLVFLLLFVDWRTLLQHKKFTLRFNIWK